MATPGRRQALLVSSRLLGAGAAGGISFQQQDQQRNEAATEDRSKSAAELLRKSMHPQTTACEAFKMMDEPSFLKTKIEPSYDKTRPAQTVDPSYPNFSRHGKNSLLRKYLTPLVYNALKEKKTSMGVTLEDLIRAGVALPWGAEPPRGVAGVYAGDEESYETFQALLDPIIRERHFPEEPTQSPLDRRLTTARSMLVQRHQTDLNPQGLLEDRIDPDGEYVLYTRMRVARSIHGVRFTPCITRGERRLVEDLFQSIVDDWKKGKDSNAQEEAEDSQYVSLMEMSNEQHDDLIRRRILYPDPDAFSLAAGTHRDWPDARGVYCNNWKDDTPSLMIWCNLEDHLWVVSNGKGGDVQGAFQRLSQAVGDLDQALHQRGYAFCEDARLGYLNASPSNLGTALRASVYVKLVHLGKQPGFDELIRRLRLNVFSANPQAERYTGIFHLSNLKALGKSEVELINAMIVGVGKLIELEKRLEKGEKLDLSTMEV